MPDYSQTRSDYLKAMMGDRNNALAPYRPEQINDIGGASFDFASLSDEDINAALKQMAGTQYEGSQPYQLLEAEQQERAKKAEEQKQPKSWFEQVGDFFSNIGTAITEGVLNVVDSVWDFTIGTTAGLFGGGWFGAQNDFTDWAAQAMTDDRWVTVATKGLTQLDVFDKGFWTNEGGYWNNWSYENIAAEQARDYEGMDWLHKGGNFVGELIPSLVLAYFTGGASLGAQAAAQAGLAGAKAYGEAQSRALSQGASFQKSAGYGAVKGAISAAIAGGMTYAGGTFASRSADSLISKAGAKVGDAILEKTGSAGLSYAANTATKFIIRVVGDAGESAALTAIEPALQQIYDENAWYNAYGTKENRKKYAEIIGKSALTAAAFSAVTNAFRDAVQIHREGGLKASVAKNEQASYERIAESQAIKSLSKADRVLAEQGAKEWESIQAEIDRVQKQYETMKANGAPDSEIEQFIGKNKQAISDMVEDYSAKYGKVFQKMSAKLHPDVAETTSNASLNKAREQAFQKFSSMSSKGAKQELANLFNGKNGISGLITYTEGSEPVETVKENDVLIAKPKTADQVQSVLASAANDKANVPTVIELPMKGGKAVQVDISTATSNELQKLALLNESDFETNKSGAQIADLGEGKSLALTSDRTEGQIIDTKKADEWVKPLELKAEASVIKEAAQAKVGKVYSLSSAKETVKLVEDKIKELLAKDDIEGGESKLSVAKGSAAKALFDNLNLGTAEQQLATKEALRSSLLDTKVKYTLSKDFYTGEADEYTNTVREMLSVLDNKDLDQFNEDFDQAWNELIKSGDESRLSKVIGAYQEKVADLLSKAQNLKASVKLTGHIEKHKGKLLNRYYHNDGEDFAPGFDFDTKGFKSLLQPLNDLELTNGKQSYTGKSTIEGFKKFLDIYSRENFLKPTVEQSPDVIAVSSLYNQGLRDVANYLVESIEKNSYVNSSGKVIYRALNSEQLAYLRLFQDTVEAMPKMVTKDRLEAVSDARSAYHGVDRYVSSITKGQNVGAIRNFIQGYSERYANQLDTIVYEIGDNALSRSIYNDLYATQAQAAGMRDDFQSKMNQLRKETGVSNKQLNAPSNTFKDSVGKPIELGYLEHIYRHLLSGEESNNVKYINANTVYIKNAKNKLVHIAKFSYSDLPTIESELKENGLLDYSRGLHKIESKDLGDIYDEDYLRDTHIPNSNRLKDYTHIELVSNKSDVGKAYVKSAVAKYGQQKDRVDTIPSGVHLVIRNGESAIMSQVANQANIHFNDPVLKKINGMLGTKLDDSGKTVKEYLSEHQPGALKLIDRAVRGAYGLGNPDHSQPIIDFIGNGYVMTLIGLNPSSMMKQPISIMWSNDIRMDTVLRFTIGANLNPKIWKNSTRLIKEIEEEFPSLRLRKKKNEALMGNTASDRIGKVQKAIGNVAGFGLKMSDAWTVGHEAIGLLSIQGQNLGYGEVGTEANDAYVKSHYKAFYATQVSSDKITMSGARAGYYGGIGKLTSFMTGAVQGQIAYLLRAGQQIQEFGNKTDEYYSDLIAKTKEAEETAKMAYENAERAVKDSQDAYEEGLADRDDIKAAKQKAKEAFDEYSKATGARADAETSARGFKHFKEMGGTRGVVVGRLATMLVTGITLGLIGELNSRLKGQKSWSEFDASSAGLDLALNSTVGWLPAVRDLVNAWRGYEFDVPEYAIVRTAYDLVTAVANVVKNPNDKTVRSFLKDTIQTVSAFLGIPASNVWKYVYGITKTFSPVAALEMNNLLYGASPTTLASTAKQYAEKNDIATSASLYQSLYALSKTGEISREVAVEEAKLVAEGLNPIARNVPDYIMNEDNERVVLSEDQRTKFSKEYAKANDRVARLIKTSDYKSMSSESKAKAIKKVYDLYYELAKYKTFATEPESRIGKLLAFTGGDYDIANALLLIQKNSELVDTKRMSRKEQAIRLVNQQSMTRAQKLLTLYLMGYGVTAENKKFVQNYLISLGFTKQQAEDFLPSNK